MIHRGRAAMELPRATGSVGSTGASANGGADWCPVCVENSRVVPTLAGMLFERVQSLLSEREAFNEVGAPHRPLVVERVLHGNAAIPVTFVAFDSCSASRATTSPATRGTSGGALLQASGRTADALASPMCSTTASARRQPPRTRPPVPRSPRRVRHLRCRAGRPWHRPRSRGRLRWRASAARCSGRPSPPRRSHGRAARAWCRRSRPATAGRWLAGRATCDGAGPIESRTLASWPARSAMIAFAGSGGPAARRAGPLLSAPPVRPPSRGPRPGRRRSLPLSALLGGVYGPPCSRVSHWSRGGTARPRRW